MRELGCKILVIILLLGSGNILFTSCKSGKKKTYAKHRGPSKKKTHRKTKTKKSSTTTKTASNSGSSSSSSENLSASAKATKVIKTAKSYIGTKYQYGGTTKSGMDCSGLMCTSFKSIDVTLPRRSVDQSNFGKRIYIGQLQPGDLVFFATGSSKTKITHVGLVTNVTKDGKVTFIHSSSSRGVVENNLGENYYKTRYVKASRPL